MQGLSKESLADIIRAHKLARQSISGQYEMQALEAALTDINYHTIRDLMRAGEYDKAAAYHQQAREK